MTDIYSANVIDNSRPSNDFRPRPGNLTDGQRDIVREALDGLDPDNLSQNDISRVVSTLRENNIRPSAQLAEIIEDEGFDVRQFAPPNTQNANQPPPPSVRSQLAGNDVFVQLNNLLSDSSESSSGIPSIKDFLEQVRSQTVNGRGGVVDLYA